MHQVSSLVGQTVLIPCTYNENTRKTRTRTTTSRGYGARTTNQKKNNYEFHTKYSKENELTRENMTSKTLRPSSLQANINLSAKIGKTSGVINSDKGRYSGALIGRNSDIINLDGHRKLKGGIKNNVIAHKDEDYNSKTFKRRRMVREIASLAHAGFKRQSVNDAFDDIRPVQYAGVHIKSHKTDIFQSVSTDSNIKKHIVPNNDHLVQYSGTKASVNGDLMGQNIGRISPQFRRSNIGREFQRQATTSLSARRMNNTYFLPRNEKVIAVLSHVNFPVPAQVTRKFTPHLEQRCGNEVCPPGATNTGAKSCGEKVCPPDVQETGSDLTICGRIKCPPNDDVKSLETDSYLKQCGGRLCPSRSNRNKWKIVSETEPCDGNTCAEKGGGNSWRRRRIFRRTPRRWNEPPSNDSPVLVLWYKDGLGKPIYRLVIYLL